MIDFEVERLRRLRGSALRLRKIARVLGRLPSVPDEPLLNRSACAAWRIARAASGRLRAHPYERFQKDAGLGLLLQNSLWAKFAVFRIATRFQALEVVERELKALARELDDARALTWAAELSEPLGRAQRELRALIAGVECGRAQDPAWVVTRASAPACDAAAADGSWPYLAS